MTDEEIQRKVEESRADSKAHGARLVETYRTMQHITDQDNPADITIKKGMALISAADGLENAGYVATKVGEVTIDRLIFPEVHELEDGTKVTFIAAAVATIKGYKP